MAEHWKEAKVHFEYTSHWDKDESIFRSAENITTLRKYLKRKSLPKAGKDRMNREWQRKKRLGKGMKMLGG